MYLFLYWCSKIYNLSNEIKSKMKPDFLSSESGSALIDSASGCCGVINVGSFGLSGATNFGVSNLRVSGAATVGVVSGAAIVGVVRVCAQFLRKDI